MTLVSGQYLKSNGKADKGSVTFSLVPSALDNTNKQRTNTDITVYLDHKGEFLVDLVPDDDLLGLTGDAVYQVTERVGKLQREWYLLVPDDTPIDLNTSYPGTEQEANVVVQPVPGQGVAAGGTTGQILAKDSDSDYDTIWTDPSAGGGGVTDHGALTGLSDDDHGQYARADGSRGAFEVQGAVAAHEASYSHGNFVSKPSLSAAYMSWRNGAWYDIENGFYTEAQVNSLLAGKASTTHQHDEDDLTGIKANWYGTAVQYAALGSWDADRLYVVTG